MYTALQDFVEWGAGTYTIIIRTSGIAGCSADYLGGPYVVWEEIGVPGGLPQLNAQGYVEADVKAMRAQALSDKAGANFDTLFQNGGIDSALTLTEGTSSIAKAIWAYTTRTLSSFGTLPATVSNNVWGAVERKLSSVAGLGIATEAKQDTAAEALAALHDLSAEEAQAACAAALVARNVPPVAAGASPTTIRVTDPATGLPVADADAWVTSDAAGHNQVDQTRQTDSSGEATFMLDAGVSYYLWAQKDGRASIQGQAFVAE